MNDQRSNPIRLGVVVIGRNEGARLRACLESVAAEGRPVVYVDSGSTDGSVAAARALGADVVELDASVPFSAARARNEGVRRLRELDASLEFVQFVDGDCTVVEGWWDAALAAARGDGVVVVCGRRRERHPDASPYNRACDLEWDGPAGDVESCGGDALMRIDALEEAGGFDPALVAGEEPELCLRLRGRGGRIVRVDRDMTLHDADLRRFGQWWRRAMRGGWAYAAGRARHGAGPSRFRVAQVRSALEWGALLPAVAIGLAWPTWGASLLLLGAYAALWLRVRGRMIGRGVTGRDAAVYAGFCVLAKPAEALGILRFHGQRWLGRTATLIEYKGAGGVGAGPEDGKGAAAT